MKTSFYLTVSIVVVGCCWAAPGPQFLPVAVKLEQPTYHVRTPYSVKTRLKVTDQDPEIVSRKTPYSLKTLLRVKDDKENDIQKDENIVLVPRVADVESKDELVTTTTQKISTAPSKKNRRTRPKDAKKLVWNPNSIFVLRTINDKPAEEVLRTDSASAARDLKDSTESAVVKVKQLDKE